MVRIRIDEETVITLGYDECEINDGVIPDKVLSSGVINSPNHQTICYVVINNIIDLLKEDVPTENKWNIIG